MKRLLPLAALALSACATAQTPAEAPAASAEWSNPAETPAILDIVDKFLLAVGNKDAAAYAAVTTPEGVVHMQRITKAQTGPVNRRTLAQIGAQGGDPFIERYWSPVVLVRGSIAVVWAPYELRDNGQVAHCGIDQFDMVKQPEGWRIANAMFTMEPDACDTIKPPAVAAMRPRDGWKETPLQ